jgi:hypothetical protein
MARGLTARGLGWGICRGAARDRKPKGWVAYRAFKAGEERAMQRFRAVPEIRGLSQRILPKFGTLHAYFWPIEDTVVTEAGAIPPRDTEARAPVSQVQ